MASTPERAGWIRCRLAELMGKRTIRSVAIELGVKQATIAIYYHNRFTRIECRVAFLLCQHFGVTMGEMFYLGDSGEDDKM